MGQCVLQLPHPGRKTRLELNDPHTDRHPGAQLVAVERLCHEIVRARFQAGHDVVLTAPRGQQKDVVSLRGGIVAGGAAHLKPVQLRHHPVQDRDRGAPFALHRLPCPGAVLRYVDLVSEPVQRPFQEQAGYRIIFRDSGSACPLFLQ